jgi:hypothetical protein
VLVKGYPHKQDGNDGEIVWSFLERCEADIIERVGSLNEDV